MNHGKTARRLSALLVLCATALLTGCAPVASATSTVPLPRMERADAIGDITVTHRLPPFQGSPSSVRSQEAVLEQTMRDAQDAVDNVRQVATNAPFMVPVVAWLDSSAADIVMLYVIVNPTDRYVTDVRMEFDIELRDPDVRLPGAWFSVERDELGAIAPLEGVSRVFKVPVGAGLPSGEFGPEQITIHHRSVTYSWTRNL